MPPYDGDSDPSRYAVATARSLVRDATADTGLHGTAALLQRVCRAAAVELSLRGCAVHLLTGAGSSEVAASSDSTSARAADLAFTTGEGPCLEAFRLRRPVLAVDLQQDATRWPGFVQAALEAEVAAVFCFPVQVGGVALGALELHSDHPRSLQDRELALALAFTQLTGRALLGELGQDLESPLSPLLDHRAEIYQAQGMVMVDLGVELGEALVRMRAHAFSHGVPLIDLARSIIAGASLPVGDRAD